VEPLRGSEERQAEKVMEKDQQARIRGYWNVLGATETDGTESIPLGKDRGDPMLRSRGLEIKKVCRIARPLTIANHDVKFINHDY